ncbi:hypothetical protein K457DRAFT_128787 [Linnemannia elongata AG-77]|uniref:Uncharacterized protein n=1 Tax=Linnemannia elongata AG-77 TaxID=1314771 RepID=A0A197JKQ3_9FUNG|nr:hypothetical protein K457DRAFT_128787 [Linnemannia elongata AG-77]
MSSRLLRLFAGSILLRTQAIRSIATPMRGTIAVRSEVQLAATAVGPLQFSHTAPTLFQIPRSPIRRTFATFSNKNIPPCGKQCSCNYYTEIETLISAQRWTILAFAGLVMSLAGMLFSDLVTSINITFHGGKTPQPKIDPKPTTTTDSTTE